MDDRDRWARLLGEAVADRADPHRRICQLCVDLLGVTGAGISRVTATGNHGVVCATDETSARVEDLQLVLGEGPCIDSVRAGTPVLVPDLDDADDLVVERWPAFIADAAAAGVRAVFAFPLRIGAISVGALNLYRDRPAELAAGQLTAALMAADAAAVTLLRLDGHDGSPESVDEIEGAATYHPQVHQATGMVKVQLGVTMQEAFLVLRARAFANGRSMIEVATEVVERRLRFSAEDQ